MSSAHDSVGDFHTQHRTRVEQWLILPHSASALWMDSGERRSFGTASRDPRTRASSATPSMSASTSAPRHGTTQHDLPRPTFPDLHHRRLHHHHHSPLRPAFHRAHTQTQTQRPAPRDLVQTPAPDPRSPSPVPHPSNPASLPPDLWRQSGRPARLPPGLGETTTSDSARKEQG